MNMAAKTAYSKILENVTTQLETTLSTYVHSEVDNIKTAFEKLCIIINIRSPAPILSAHVLGALMAQGVLRAAQPGAPSTSTPAQQTRAQSTPRRVVILNDAKKEKMPGTSSGQGIWYSRRRKRQVKGKRRHLKNSSFWFLNRFVPCRFNNSPWSNQSQRLRESVKLELMLPLPMLPRIQRRSSSHLPP